ncbi:6-phosphofructokinase [Oceanidesulfovibrio indonesiensis]|uniref:6-phosphofructokinase n=1 Tax=Oceanidesulfovibrio indonesiensis TaxID=54767 RepID=A0A7M3MCI7_9BACT|nr:6-phosphofructo-2-kinase/fructose-2,6-bisphosphatase [Oceanidesulfovibrio indonesiensis]TVM16027.1 6-phosphofructokinase [Oceanidesulfovibrio indonesiensis]
MTAKPSLPSAEKLYIAMVGLPAMGKSVIAYKLQDNLRNMGVAAKVFNNGEVRRRLFPENTSHAEFYNPDNAALVALREDIALINMYDAKDFLNEEGGSIAILDATNISAPRRRKIIAHLSDHPILFVECRNPDPDLYAASVARKTKLSEFAHLSTEEALASFEARIRHYRSIYCPLDSDGSGTDGCPPGEKRPEEYVIVDSLNHRIIKEHLTKEPPYYSLLRDLLVSDWVKGLCLVRHGETEFNRESRIGGNPRLTDKGIQQARSLAARFRDKHISCVVTSTLRRTREMADILLEGRPEVERHALREFDEINAGECDSMTYDEVRRLRPGIWESRKTDKYHAPYPGGESYASMKDRVERGVKKALYLSGNAENLVIIGHQAVNRMILSHFLFRREEDVPYVFIPQDRYFHIVSTQSRKLVELLPFQS